MLENIYARRAYYTALTLLVLAGLLTAAYRSLYDDVAYNMEVRLQGTADGTAWSASTVMRVDFHAEVELTPYNGGVFLHTAGQAIVVDIEGRRSLYVVNSPEDSWRLPIWDGCGLRQDGEFLPYSRLSSVRALAGPCELAPDRLPRILRFRDESDPSTTELVSLQDLRREGIVIDRVTMKRTDAPISTGLEQRLPWLVPDNPPHDRPPVLILSMQEGKQVQVLVDRSTFVYRY